MPEESAFHSTGRGGAGNIGPGEGTYTAGDIVREGLADDKTQPHSSGRGGAGNISTPPPHQQADPSKHHSHFNGLLHHHHHHHKQEPHPEAQQQAQPNGSATHPQQQNQKQPVSDDYIPESATRTVGQAGYENFHTGRGGEGNIHRDRFGGHSNSAAQAQGEGTGEGAAGRHHGSTGDALKEKALHVVGLDK